MTSTIGAAERPRQVALTGGGSEASVVLHGLSKSFAKSRSWRAILTRQTLPPVRALSDVSCEVKPGEFFGLLGENGAGKTTLFKILATLVTPDQGSATVCGLDVMGEAAAVREVLAPVIADERSLNWRLTARENMKLFATLHGLRGSDASRRIAELITLVDLGAAADRLVSGFSSGMKQRLLVARTLLARPRVLLLDEPTRSLDPISARSFRTFLRQEVAVANGCTVLLATHNAEEAFELCDRVGVLHQGKLVAVGQTADLARNVGEDRFAVWIRPSNSAPLDALSADGVIRALSVGIPEGDWTRFEFDAPKGLDDSARVVSELTRHGVKVARCERVKLSLAELLERVLAQHAASRDA